MYLISELGIAFSAIHETSYSFGAVAQFAEHIHLSVICKAKTESFKILAFNAKI
ncbi:MAG: hypothetical protein ABIF85_07275 [Nanoarchaeota archaeon]|nr:hypothetical protein [Nanoarchaeota archaeon]MBU4299795.1 hypothetical protein [Nanoarchaeota archaeon]MBU4451273.1 hypothetical protein [Nanoarchaeota archaeon]MCG2724017.1 hypothetical protein [archaeon]